MVYARSYLAPLDTPAGQLVLATVLAIFAAGFAWLHRLTRPRQHGLFLANSDGITKTDAGPAGAPR